MLNYVDAVTLARIQFAFTISFHILLPAFTIGLASYLAVLEVLWLKTGRGVYFQVFRYWIRIFAVIFALGVVSGLVMSYQFGTNWSVFSDKAGAVLGPLMGYEVLSAFFLEAGFLGVMLFGLERVGKGLHCFATIMVAIGTLFSAFWILSANSWMQTPAGFAINKHGQFVPADWLAIIFNPSFPYRLIHMVLAAYLTTAFVVGAVAAYHLLRRQGGEATRVMFSMALWMAALVTPLQLVAGDQHGLNTLKYQPAKIAAIEGHFETQRGAPLILFGWPDMAAQETLYKIEIPYLSSLILTHSWDGEIPGLKQWPRADQPNATIIFWTFRIMVGLGFLMLGLGIASVILRWRGRLYDTPWLQRWALLMGPSGFIAILAGWITTEVGRQPYTIYNHLRTVASASPIAAPAVAASLTAFVVVYLIVFSAGLLYALKLMAHAPGEEEPPSLAGQPIRSAGITPAPALASARTRPVASGGQP